MPNAEAMPPTQFEDVAEAETHHIVTTADA